MGGCANSFRVTHRVLMSCCSSFCRSFVDLSGCASEVVTHRCSGKPHARSALHTQGTSEGFPPHREVVTLGRGVQVRSPTGCGGVGIGDDGWSAIGTRAGGHPQQLALGGSLSTSDAGPDRAREGCVGRARRDVQIACHRETTLPLRAISDETGAHRPCSRCALPRLVACPPRLSRSVSAARRSTWTSGCRTTFPPGRRATRAARLPRRRRAAAQRAGGPAGVVRR